MILSLNNELEAVFGELSKTLLFEYQTISELAGFFMENHTEKLLTMVGAPETQANPQTEAVETQVTQKPEEEAPVFGRQRFAVLPGVQEQDEEIAIIGMAVRFPQANDLEAFWDNLRQGRDCIDEIPADRWDHSLWFNPDKDHKGTTYSKWGGFIDDVDKFDPLFFNISPREATMIDPQERLFLQSAWHTFEDAGYLRSKVKGREIGVYVGVMWGQY